jgi:hypothetical protein
MKDPQPTRKDLAEFFRLCLLVGLSTPVSIVDWACKIVAEDAEPDLAFIDLACGASQPSSVLLTLLAAVPGEPTPDLPWQMLLGHVWSVSCEVEFPAQRVLGRLQLIGRVGNFPKHVVYKLDEMDDYWALALTGEYGTVRESAREFAAFLAKYEAYVFPGMI